MPPRGVELHDLSLDPQLAHPVDVVGDLEAEHAHRPGLLGRRVGRLLGQRARHAHERHPTVRRAHHARGHGRCAPPAQRHTTDGSRRRHHQPDLRPWSEPADQTSDKKVLLAAPRGYCAGVDRAVVTVEKALELYGPPVYVRKQIVHNKHVVSTLEKRGAIFVDETDEVPEGATVIFSAHGVAPVVHDEAQARAASRRSTRRAPS